MKNLLENRLNTVTFQPRQEFFVFLICVVPLILSIQVAPHVSCVGDNKNQPDSSTHHLIAKGSNFLILECGLMKRHKQVYPKHSKTDPNTLTTVLNTLKTAKNTQTNIVFSSFSRLCGVFTEPLSLLVTGPNELVTKIEKAWFMRLLQPPQGFMLQRLGKISQLTASLIRQRPAAKLSDACLVSMNILTRANLTSGNQNGPYLGVDQIRRQLSFSFPNIVVPDYARVRKSNE